MQERFDLVVANARDADGRAIDLGVRDERIVTIATAGELSSVSAASRIDATERTVLPGVVDPHTHLNFPFDQDPSEGMQSETIAAAAGGVTTVGHYPLGIRGDLVEHLSQAEKIIVDSAHVDVALAYPILESPHIEQMDELRAQGITSFKLLRAYRSPDVYEFGGIDDSLLYRAMLKVADMNDRGLPTLLKIHCENVEIFKVFKEDLQAQYPDLGRDEPLTDVTWAHCRPSVVETESVVSALYLARHTGCPIMIVHLSAGSSLDPIRRAKQEGTRVLVETTPLYLETDAYTTGAPNGPHWTRVQPSVKFRNDAEALWGGVVDGSVDLIGTDHAATRKEVYTGKSVWDHGASGRSILGISLAIMLDGVHRGRLSLGRLREVMCEVPARAMGLQRRKGRLECGFDADLVLCDLNLAKEVTADDLHSRADHSCFEGRVLTGWPTTTILRGKVIWRDGRLVEPSRGCFMPGGSG